MYPSSTSWHQAGTRWDQVKGVPAHHLTKGRVYPFSSNGGHKLTEPKQKIFFELQLSYRKALISSSEFLTNSNSSWTPHYNLTM